MILMGVSIAKYGLGILLTSIVVLVLVIAYRKMLTYFGRERLIKEHYAVLYELEKPRISGEVEFYFTVDQPKHVILSILDSALQELLIITDADFGIGGHIVRYDTSGLSNGIYFYCLRSDNQKTMKRMVVQHDKVSA